MNNLELEDIKNYINKHKGRLCGGRENNGMIGITQKIQFREISQNGIPVIDHLCKADMKYSYRVWTFTSEQEAVIVYDHLLEYYGNTIKESKFTKREEMKVGESYIYLI